MYQTSKKKDPTHSRCDIAAVILPLILETLHHLYGSLADTKLFPYITLKLITWPFWEQGRYKIGDAKLDGLFRQRNTIKSRYLCS